MYRNHNNRSYYICLSIIQCILLFYVFYKKKNRKSILLTFLSIVGLAYYFEYPVYIFRGYKYKTKILKNREQDNSLGAVLSQTLFVPAVAIFISTFQLGWKVKVWFTIYFVLIERFFLKLNIYRNRWWRTSFTALSVFAYFFISDACYKGIKEGNKVSLKLALYNMIHITYMFFLFIASLLNNFRYQPIFKKDSWYYHYAYVKIYLVLETVIATYLLQKKQRWLAMIPLLTTVTIDSFLMRIKFLKVKGSYWVSVFPARLAAYLLSFLFQNWIKRYEMSNSKQAMGFNKHK